MVAAAQSPPSAPVRSAARATAVAFIGSGFAFASWASRIPAVKSHFDLAPSALGILLLAVAAGSVVALPLSGSLIGRFGAGRLLVAMALLLAVGLAAVAVGQVSTLAAVAVGLFLMGFANGAWDVAMNVQATVVERRLGRSVMSRFHAGFSVGTVAGALVGAGLVALGVPVTAHLLGVAVLVVAVVPAAARRFLPDTEPAADSTRDDSARDDGERGGALAAWTEPRTLLIGVFVFGFAFAEGSGNDWISVAMIDGYGSTPAFGTLAFATFLAAMTVGRWFGPGLLDRHGRVPVLRRLALLGVLGLALFVVGWATPLAYLGAALWGLGTSLGFPVAMSAAADDPVRAAARVSVVASLGYCAFLAGPPLLGFLGDQVGSLRALSAVAVLLAASFLVAGAVRAPAGDPAQP